MPARVVGMSRWGAASSLERAIAIHSCSLRWGLRYSPAVNLRTLPSGKKTWVSSGCSNGCSWSAATVDEPEMGWGTEAGEAWWL